MPPLVVHALTFLPSPPHLNITNMKTRTPHIALTAALLALPGALLAQNWDPGTYTTRIDGTLLNQTSLFQSYRDASIVGGERDIFTSWGQGNDVTTVEFESAGWQYGTHYIASSWASGRSGVTDIVWDGLDDNAAINHTGLGGIDLASSHKGLQFGLTGDFNDVTWDFYFYSDANRFSKHSITKSGNIAWETPELFSVDFDDFIASGASGGADFANIGAIRIVIDGSADTGVDAAIHGLRFTPIPEPSSVLLLFTSAVCLMRRKRTA